MYQCDHLKNSEILRCTRILNHFETVLTFKLKLNLQNTIYKLISFEFINLYVEFCKFKFNLPFTSVLGAYFRVCLLLPMNFENVNKLRNMNDSFVYAIPFKAS